MMNSDNTENEGRGTKTLTLDDDAHHLLMQVKKATGAPKGTLAAKAILYWAPRVLSGELSIVEPEKANVGGGS